MMRIAVSAAIALAVAACQSVPENYIQFHAGTDATTVSKHIAEKVGACWFDGSRQAFADYSYAPEAGNSSTRILIVPKEAPHERPLLVIEVLRAKRGSDVRLFGPMMQSGEADSLRDDVRRWTGGARNC